MTIHNLTSLLGIPVMLGVAWVFSTNRRRVNWRLLGWGLALQLGFALLLFHVPLGIRVFSALNRVVVLTLGAASAGSEFLFGRLALPPGAVNAGGEPSLGFILAFQAFPTIIFFSALMSILYHLGVMQRVIRGFSRLFVRLMGISGAESLCAASNIFVGIESALTVRPYLKDMTRSEFCTVLTVGMATVASNVLALYVFCLKDALPTIAAHLVSASILSAPAGLIMSKLLLPEDGQPLTLGVAVKPHYEREHSLFEAVISGAHAGARLILGIAVLLLAVLGLIALFDLLLGAVGGRVNTWCGLSLDWSLAGLLGYAFSPLTFMLGVPPEDVMTVSRLIGLRSVATEVAAYQALTPLVAAHAIAPRSAVITTYALCGFAHVASMAIFVGGITALVPERARAISAVGLRALAAATLACLLTACVAGVVYTAGVDSILLRSVHVP